MPVPAANRLVDEASPYLRQHAGNPVDWYPWGAEAFARARAEDRPVILSVGYSACHWCHVMAHDCFEDADTADAMNAGFINIKVDREERPDVDSIYMEAVQAIAGGGGWPMTVFLLPDGRPFFGGTYFPRVQFNDLLRRVRGAWEQRREGLEADAAQLAEAVTAGTGLPLGNDRSAPRAGDDLVETTVAGLLGRYDPEWGGFGSAPKFPQASMTELLLWAWAAGGRGDDPLGEAAITTLDAMASGGIYDHLGGGFARYSTDRRWLVPHFEKMLYDNALLARLYTHAWQLTGEPRYRQVVTEIFEYLLSPPMRQPGAGFSSAEDADSEGVEGRYYVWDASEVETIAGSATAAWYGVSEGGNWEGHNILWRPRRADLIRPPEVSAGRRALLAERDRRIRPGLDDKVLTEWNAMAIAALAEAGAAMGVPAWVEAAEDVGNFLLGALRRPDGRWLRAWRAGKAAHLAYASDHAWIVEACTRLAEATGKASWVAEARRGADALIELFWDGEASAFATTGSDAEILIARPTETYDGATPSANSVAATALFRLAALTGDDRYRERAAQVVAAMGAALGRAPTAFTALVAAAELDRAGITEVVVTGDRRDLVDVVAHSYRPTTVLAWGETFDSPLWEGRRGVENEGLAFVCRDFTCAAPTGDAAVLADQLGESVADEGSARGRSAPMR
ncbi:MAG: thioredoxin domain-containing protein [Actinomycetota bacterium]|nr:thioredoxin domain-containing protein [Actinomycetota bacterium]